MEVHLKKLICGECGEEKHLLFQRSNGEILVKCIKCKNVSDIKITKPKIVIGNVLGLGILCPES